MLKYELKAKPTEMVKTKQNKTKQNKTRPNKTKLAGRISVLKRLKKNQGSICYLNVDLPPWIDNDLRKRGTAYLYLQPVWASHFYIPSWVLATCQLESFSGFFRTTEWLVTGEASEMCWWHLLFQLRLFTFLSLNPSSSFLLEVVRKV